MIRVFCEIQKHFHFNRGLKKAKIKGNLEIVIPHIKKETKLEEHFVKCYIIFQNLVYLSFSESKILSLLFAKKKKLFPNCRIIFLLSC